MRVTTSDARGPSYLTLKAKTWETNALGFYFYERPIITSVTPLRTPSIGNGLIALAGAHFASGLNPRCRIGDISVDALRVAASLVTCEAPSGKAGSTVSVGLMSTAWCSVVPKSYYDEPELVSLTPRTGSRAAALPLLLKAEASSTAATGLRSGAASGRHVYKPLQALDDVVSCVTPALEDHVEVSLSLNGGADRSASLPFRIYEDEPVLQGMSPALGS